MSSPPLTTRPRWPLERVLFALAGTMTLVSAALAALASKWFLLLTALIGVNQLLFVVRGACPGSVLLRRAFRLRSAIYPDPSVSCEQHPTRIAREQLTV